jgi:hypothetical protein
MQTLPGSLLYDRHPEALGAQRRASKGDAEVIQLAHLWRHLGRSPSRLPRIKSGVAPQRLRIFGSLAMNIACDNRVVIPCDD